MLHKARELLAPIARRGHQFVLDNLDQLGSPKSCYKSTSKWRIGLCGTTLRKPPQLTVLLLRDVLTDLIHNWKLLMMLKLIEGLYWIRLGAMKS